MFYGLDIDKESRCRHYHTAYDVVSLQCHACQKYYACYHCHDEMETHCFVASTAENPYPVLCGVCHHYLSLADYKKGVCLFCQAPFNPNCQRHDAIYFSKETLL